MAQQPEVLAEVVAAQGDTTHNSVIREVSTMSDTTQYNENQITETVVTGNIDEILSAALIDANTHRLAALMVAGLSCTQAARALGMRDYVARRIVNTTPFKMEQLRLLAAAVDEAMAGAIATKAGRLQELSQMANDLRHIKEARAQACDIRNMPDSEEWWNANGIDYQLVRNIEGLGENFDPTSPIMLQIIPSSVQAPGADTGMLTRSFKVIGRGLGTQTIEEWEIDTALNKQLLDLHERTARELGQWTEKTETTITQKMYVGVAIQDI